MSIPNIFNKIKDWMGIDITTFLYVCVMIGVGVTSFGLGRLSAVNISTHNTSVRISNNEASSLDSLRNTKSQVPISSSSSTTSSPSFSFVASKNGKLYYTASCTGANRIKEENKIWFATESEAQDGGYTRSSSCK